MPFTLSGDWVPKEPEKTAAPSKGVKVREVKRKKALLTIVYHLDPSRHNLQEIAATLKKRLGVGGGVHDDSIELQGTKGKETIALLQEMGIKAS